MTTPFQPLPCDTTGGGTGDAGVDVEGTLVCDVDAGGNVVGTALVEAVYDETGARTGTQLVNILDGTPYVPLGTVQPCREGCCPDPVVLCDVAADGTSVQFIRAYTGDEAGNLDAVDTLLDGTVYVPTGTVGSCDPYRLCTPDSSIDLAADCGPGEVADPVIIAGEGVASDASINDDPSADALCGGVWDRPATPQTAPFPVAESFRNDTFDEPPVVTQGTAPYAQLTSTVIDGTGDGWLRMSDTGSFTNGMYQIATPFPNTENVTAGVTFAAHDGSIPGGDGLAFVLTDGAEPGAQGTPIGGGGGLGLGNWEGGYVGIVLDEYGGTSSTGAGNTIKLLGIGGLYTGVSIAEQSVAPHFINQTTRTAPGRLITSVITEAGQTYVSASVDWNDGNGPVQYFDRVNVTPTLGPAPATLRMGLYGGSGGAFRDIKEFRDLVAVAGGVQNWRAFPITTDPVPACATTVSVRVCTNVTFTDDSQTAGNANPEAFLWLVNDATNVVVDTAQVSSLPSQVGTPHELCVDAIVPPAQVGNLRVYVGAETRDANGAYGQAWEDLVITATALGCPAVAQRTLAISAPCPIPVTIVGGSADGGTGGGNTIVNTPATFEDVPVCITVAGEASSGFRREVRAADGTVTVTFLGESGLPLTPDSWVAGVCPAPVFAGFVCDVSPVVPATLATCPGTPLATSEPVTTEDVNVAAGPLYEAVANTARLEYGAQDVCSVSLTLTGDTGLAVPLYDVLVDWLQQSDGTAHGLSGGGDGDSAAAMAVAMGVGVDGLAGPGTTGTIVVGTTTVTLTIDGPGSVHIRPGSGSTMGRQPGDGDTQPVTFHLDFSPPVQGLTFIFGTTGNDDTGTGRGLTGSQLALATPGTDASGGAVEVKQFRNVDGTSFYETLDGTPHTVAGVIGTCDPRTESVILCDFGAFIPPTNTFSVTRFLRTFYRDAAGVLLNTVDTDLATGAPYTPTGANGVGSCGALDSNVTYFCDLGNLDGPGGTPHIFWRNQQFDSSGSFQGQNAYDATGNAQYPVVGPVVPYPCSGAATSEAGQIPEALTLCDITQVPELDGARSALNLPALANGPTAGAFANGITFTVDQGVAGGSGTYLITTNTTQTWTFSEPAMLRFGVNNLNVGAECVTLPVGTVVESIHPNHVYNAGTRVLCNGGAAAATDESIFTLDGATSLPIVSNAGGGGQRGLVRLEAGLTTFTEVRTPFLRTICRTCGEAPVITDTALDGVTPYVPAGTVGVCDTPFAPVVAVDVAGRDVEQVILCDNNGPFVRVYQYNDQSGLPSGVPNDYTLAGAPHVAVGPVVNCGSTGVARDEELLILCDATPTRFLRRYNYDATTGALIGVVNTTLDGATPFVPVGAVGICTTAIASDFDFLSTVLCDANGVQFIQRLTFNSATGAVTATTNTTLTGAAFAPVAPVALCTSCCPVVMAEGCTNVGSLRYTALRLANGTIALLDSVTGATVLPANIITCASDDVARTLTAQARLIADADAPWTPGADVAGTLTAVTLTVLSGTATLTDQNGTVLAGLPAGFSASWAVEDDNALTGPTSIDAIGGSTVVHWTQR